MILRRIRLNNFRQFYGEQTIEIAEPGDKNVTLVHAENGVGKTTLLNSILWAFFGDTTARFEQKDQIVNFTARREGKEFARVEVEFKHEDNVYLAIRDLRSTPGGRVKVEFGVRRYESNGSLSAPLGNPDEFVNSVMPRNMAPYFFFDGEQAEAFSSEKNNKKVGEAIRDILGCTLLENGISDLDYLARQFDKELGALQGLDRISQLEGTIEELSVTRESQQKAYDTAVEELATLDELIQKANASLRAAEAAAALQREREQAEERLKHIATEITQAQGEIVQWIGSRSLPLASARLAETANQFVESESLRGRIPSPYNEEFVKNLLEAGRCVCDRELEPASNEWRAVHRLLHSAANVEAMTRVVRARSRIGTLMDLRAEAPRVLELLQSQVARLLDERRAKDQLLDRITKELEGSPEADIQRREAARTELLRKRDACRDVRIRAQSDIERLDGDIRRLRTEVAELAQKNQKAMRLVTRREAALQASEKLRELLRHYEGEARAAVQDSVNEILDRVARKDFRLQIGENFELTLLYRDGTPAPKSGGENQLMSLAFIAALVDFSRKRSAENGNRLFVPATVAPLILDSPFGQLDDVYRAGTARFVPAMAPQVVLLVSSSQGKSEVVDALAGKVGREYVLVAENVASKGERQQDLLTVQGRQMPTTLFNCDRDSTRIQELVP